MTASYESLGRVLNVLNKYVGENHVLPLLDELIPIGGNVSFRESLVRLRALANSEHTNRMNAHWAKKTGGGDLK